MKINDIVTFKDGHPGVSRIDTRRIGGQFHKTFLSEL